MSEQLDSAVSLLGKYGTILNRRKRVQVVAVTHPVEGLLVHPEQVGNDAIEDYAWGVLSTFDEFIVMTESDELYYCYVGDNDFELETE